MRALRKTGLCVGVIVASTILAPLFAGVLAALLYGLLWMMGIEPGGNR